MVVGPLFAWICLFAAYLVFAGQASLDEGAAGAVFAAAAVLWWIATRRASTHAFSFDAASWRALWRACRKLPGATLSVGAALLRAVTRRQGGEVVHSFYAHGGHGDPGDAGRRAVGVLAASLAPDSFVLRTPTEHDELVVHALPVGPAPKDPRWPI